jgi:8-oxo-dGTP pyrophosphatase MutT (NUDIX family)
LSKIISAGVLVTDSNSLLICHVTNSRHWDIPKGKVDPGETFLDAAVRELQEETGLLVNPNALMDLGIFAFKKDKDLSLWLWQVDTMPDPKTCICTSTFDHKGQTKTEMDGFANVPWKKLGKFVVPDMFTVLCRVMEKINVAS